jgi:curved DNA-binding protein CbpA
MLRTDTFAPPKKPTCQHGEPCGGACIDPNESCRVNLSPQMQAQIQGLKTNLLNQVPGGREINTARAVLSDFNQVRKAGSLGQQAMYLGAVLAGASAIGYAKYREKYRAGFDNSAEVASRRAQGMANGLPDLKGKKDIIFTVDSSLSKGDKGRGNGLAEELGKDPDFANTYHMVSIKQNAHQNPRDLDSLSPRDRQIAEALTPIKQAVQNARNGQNDASVELASQILAYHQKYGETTENEKVWDRDLSAYVYRQKKVPNDFKINVLGHGDGGMVAHEAMEILKKIPAANAFRDNIGIVGLNTPDAGLTDTIGRVKTIASRNSPLSLLPMKQKVTMDAPDGEGGRLMVRKPEVKQFIQGHYGGTVADVVKTPAAVTAVPKAPVVQTQTPQPVQQSTSQGGVVKTTSLSGNTTGQQSLSFKPVQSGSLGRQTAQAVLAEIDRTKSLGADVPPLDSPKALKAAYPNLPDTHIYDILSINGLPRRLKTEFQESRLPLDTAVEIGREISGDDTLRSKYMQHLMKLRSRKPNSSIDPLDYRRALENTMNPSFDSTHTQQGATMSSEWDSSIVSFYQRSDDLMSRLDALNLDNAAPVCKKGKLCNGKCIPQSWQCGKVLSGAIGAARGIKKFGSAYKQEVQRVGAQLEKENKAHQRKQLLRAAVGVGLLAHHAWKNRSNLQN